MIRAVNLAEKFAQFADHWNPRLAGELNGQQVRLVKFQGPFTWHHHAQQDELFFVVRGEFEMRLREGGVECVERVRAGEFIIVPRGTEHCPYAEQEVEVMLFEPASTLNTGNVRDERTRDALRSV